MQEVQKEIEETTEKEKDIADKKSIEVGGVLCQLPIVSLDSDS